MSIAVENKSVQKPDVLSYREALLPKKDPGLQAYSVWIVSLCFVLFQFFIQLSSGEIVNGLMQSFGLTAFGGGVLASAYYYIYVSLQIPAGVLMGQYGPRKLLSAGAMVLAIGSFLFAGTHHVVVAFLGRLVMGLGAAFAFVGTMFLTDKWFPRERFAVMAGLVEMVGMIGTLIGIFWLAHYVEAIGWRRCMLYCSAFAAVLSVILGLVIRDMPANRRPLSTTKAKRRVLPGLRVLIRMRVAWANGIYSGFMFMSVTVFAALWALPYFQEAQNMSLVEATAYSSLMYVAVGVFSPCLGFIDAHVKHRRYLMCGLAILGFVVMMLIILFPTMPRIELGICMFVLGIASSGYMLTFPVANQIAAMRIRSASIGFVNMLSVGASPIFQSIVGLILFLLAHHDHPTQISLYSVHEYQMSLLVIPACLAVAAWLALFIPSRK